MSTGADDLFPPPCSPPSLLIPRIWPGVNHETIVALREVLKDNQKWDIFFNDRGFHNHIAHRALAIWSLGAPGDVIQEGYKRDSSYQRQVPESPGPITLDNFKDHVANKRYYAGYLAFFTDIIREKGIAAAVEQFIFSKEFTYTSKGRHPDMLGRFFGGLFHPMIHIGHGFEFCLPGLVAEGLAQAALHSDDSSALIPESFFEEHHSSRALDDTVSRLKSLVISEAPTEAPATSSVHVFTILARILNDPELGNIQDDPLGGYNATVTKHGATLIKHMKDWHVDPTNQRDIEQKIEELSWLNTLIYAVGGSQPGKPFNADFSLMHMVTSSLFLPSYMTFLKPHLKSLLLRSYLFASLGWWVARGRPELNIKAFYEATSAHPIPSGRGPTPKRDAILSDDPKGRVPNPWLPIVENAIVHPDEHLPKAQRTFVHYATLYGSREAGLAEFKKTELVGADKLDGTLFIRAAALTDARKVKEGAELGGFWDRYGFSK